MRFPGAIALAFGTLLLSLLGGCLESSVVECAWGLFCPGDQLCHEGLHRCVRPVQVRVCEEEGASKSDGSACNFPGSGPQHSCRKGACVEPMCGDGVTDTESGEQCDDGNYQDHDGCSTRCRQEELLWQALTPSGASPPARFFTAMAFDEQQQRVILFGGIGRGRNGEDQLLDDTWILNLDLEQNPPGAQWERWDAGDQKPSPRSNHAMAFDTVRERAVLVGGSLPTGPAYDTVSKADTWVFGAEGWQELSPSKKPPRLKQHALVWDAKRKQALLSGGKDYYGFPGKSAWLFDGLEWKTYNTSPAPEPRWDHLMVYDDHRDLVLVAGGYNGQGASVYPQTWEFDGVAWQRLPGVEQEPVTCPTAYAFDSRAKKVILHSGLTREGEKLLAQRIIPHVLEFDGRSWRKTALEADDPVPRMGHSMVSLGKGGGVLLFGGTDGTDAASTRMNDLWFGRYDAGRPSDCGNGVVDEGEGCDAGGFRGGMTCESLGYLGGLLRCRNCEVDTSTCFSH